ncbi:Thiol peroxidase, Bcp-type [Cronobacter dublinensis 582]|nr:Thiol peroxidase, Bcp-type [Cronobacter dublinensis 582]
MMNPLKAGDIAPKFSLPDQDGEQVNLTDFQGQRVLVYFYPKAMTPGCTVQACGLRDNMDDLKKAGVEVLGISTDKPEKLSRFAEKELLNFTLLSDEDHQVSEQFGVWGEKSFMGKTYDGIHRISFLIDADGKVEHVFNDFKTSNHHDTGLAERERLSALSLTLPCRVSEVSHCMSTQAGSAQRHPASHKNAPLLFHAG